MPGFAMFDWINDPWDLYYYAGLVSTGRTKSQKNILDACILQELIDGV